MAGFHLRPMASGLYLWDRMLHSEFLLWQEAKKFTARFFDDGEWLAVTSEGYYNSSEKGAQHLKVNFEGEDYSVDQFYDVFYRPDIVAAKLSGQDISGLASITMKDTRKSPPPLIELTSNTADTDQKKAKVCYRIRNTGGGIGEVRLFHNGKLIQSDGYYREIVKSPANEQIQLVSFNSRDIYADMRSISVKGRVDMIQTSTETKGDLFEECREIDSIQGENEVSVAAFNSSNTIQSTLKTVKFISHAKSEDPNMYILAVGIDRYKDKTANLKYAAKDATGIGDKLKTQAATLYRAKNIHYDILTDENATKTKIREKMNEDLPQNKAPGRVHLLLSPATGYCYRTNITSLLMISTGG